MARAENHVMLKSNNLIVGSAICREINGSTGDIVVTSRSADICSESRREIMLSSAFRRESDSSRGDNGEACGISIGGDELRRATR